MVKVKSHRSKVTGHMSKVKSKGNGKVKSTKSGVPFAL